MSTMHNLLVCFLVEGVLGFFGGRGDVLSYDYLITIPAINVHGIPPLFGVT